MSYKNVYVPDAVCSYVEPVASGVDMMWSIDWTVHQTFTDVADNMDNLQPSSNRMQDVSYKPFSAEQLNTQ